MRCNGSLNAAHSRGLIQFVKMFTFCPFTFTLFHLNTSCYSRLYKLPLHQDQLLQYPILTARPEDSNVFIVQISDAQGTRPKRRSWQMVAFAKFSCTSSLDEEPHRRERRFVPVFQCTRSIPEHGQLFLTFSSVPSLKYD